MEHPYNKMKWAFKPQKDMWNLKYILLKERNQSQKAKYSDSNYMTFCKKQNYHWLSEVRQEGGKDE